MINVPLTIFPKPRPARIVLSDALGITVHEAKDALIALVEAGYGIGPREPTNGMLAAYIEATRPARHHEAIITAIAKARVRWQAMLAQGTSMALSLKYTDRAQAIECGGAAEGKSAVGESRDAQPPTKEPTP